ncbi:MAG TPA: hypothetical protein V6D08_05950 [Candidatus Obscuribacterales bacterium]
MNKEFKPLDRDRKYGIVLFLLTIVSFTIAYNAVDSGIQAAFAFVGVASFVTIMVLMGKAVDANGGWDDTSAAGPEEDHAPAPEPVDQEQITWGNREFTPLDPERKLGIVFFLLTVAAFAVGYNTSGWIQAVAMVAGIVSFLTIFVLMDRSMERQKRNKRKK